MLKFKLEVPNDTAKKFTQRKIKRQVKKFSDTDKMIK